MRALALFFAAALAAPSQAQQPKSKEAAFGFSKGMTLKQAEAVAPLRKGPEPLLYVTETPPKPVSPFRVFSIYVSKTTGVCAVIGFSEPVPADSHDIESDHDSVMQMLVERYGKPSKQSRSERMAGWVSPQGPDTLIGLAVKTIEGKSALMVMYKFSNYEKCQEEAREGL